MKGLRENALKCKHTGGRPPLGYNVASDKTYVINPEEAEAVQMIFNMYVNGTGYSKIIDALNEKGIKTKKGQTFGKNSLLSILKNEKYKGVYVYNQKLCVYHAGKKRDIQKSDEDIIRIPGGMPQIISDELFEEVQARMTIGNQMAGANSAKRVYLLSGKIVCGHCGAAMTGKSGKMGRNKSYYSYYECSARKRLRNCTGKPINCDFVEDVVINLIYDNLLSPEKIDFAADMIFEAAQKREDDLPLVLSRYQKELQSIEKSIEGIVKAITDGMYDPIMKEKMAELRASQQQYQIRIKEIETQINIHSLSRDQIYSFLKMYQEIKSMPKAQQKKAIALFVDKVHVYDEKVVVDVLTVFEQKNSADNSDGTTFDRLGERSNFIGGDGGNRTRVRKPIHMSLSECSLSFNIPSPDRRQAGYRSSVAS